LCVKQSLGARYCVRHFRAKKWALEAVQGVEVETVPGGWTVFEGRFASGGKEIWAEGSPGS
jgi:hypothetical protein